MDSMRIRHHEQAYQALEFRKVWAFKCPDCDQDYYWRLRAAVVQPDGSLRCPQHSERTGLLWCEGCERPLPKSAFVLPDPEEGEGLDGLAYAYWKAQGCPERTSLLCSACTEKAEAPASRQCERCEAEMPEGARSDARFCSSRCRTAAHRAKQV